MKEEYRIRFEQSPDRYRQWVLEWKYDYEEKWNCIEWFHSFADALENACKYYGVVVRLTFES